MLLFIFYQSRNDNVSLSLPLKRSIKASDEDILISVKIDVYGWVEEYQNGYKFNRYDGKTYEEWKRRERFDK